MLLDMQVKPQPHRKMGCIRVYSIRSALLMFCAVTTAVCLLQLRDADNLSVVADASTQPTLLAVAAKFPAKDSGTVRLIDNMVIGGSL